MGENTYRGEVKNLMSFELSNGKGNAVSLKEMVPALPERRASLRDRIKIYKKRAEKIEAYLSKKTEDWGKFQSEFNSEVNGIFREIMNFEKVHLSRNDTEKVIKLKKIFIHKIKEMFDRGEYGKWSIRKPYGYAGDFKIMDEIYKNNPSSEGFERLFDNYFQMSAICVAVRNRKEDFKRIITDAIVKERSTSIRIMDLASGPCRDLKEIFSMGLIPENKNVIFDCYDNDSRAIEYAKKLLQGFSNVNFINENVLRLAAAKDINSRVGRKYNLVYSTGLFDYLDYKISVRLARNLRELLTPKGVLAASNVRDKYSNPSVYYMEWMGDWNLIYRSDEDFKQIFLDAGFAEKSIKTRYEQQGILQYILAAK